MLLSNNPMMGSPLQRNIRRASSTLQPIPNLQPTPAPLVPPETGLPRVIQYYADFSGCGFWRMIWPEHMVNAYNHCTAHGSTVMCLDPRWYTHAKVVRIQRQATEHQLMFVKFLKEVQKQVGFRLIYEIDDIVFYEDIPEYNKFKPAFTDPNIRKNIVEIMNLCDEITVTCQFMKDYYEDKTGHKNITIIPNYPPKMWIGNHYDPKWISDCYDQYQKKPRILYTGSGAHFDVENRVGQNDDFAHVIKAIADTVDEFQWVFLGAFPLPLRQYVEMGKIEFHPWASLYNYAEKIKNLRVNMMVAPLQDNNFNKSKSDLKLIEANAFGIPIACQDLCTYEDAPFKFKTGEEMIETVREVLSKKGRYMNLSAKARATANTRWLENEDNLKSYVELFTLPWKDKNRTKLNAINGITL